ncbi:TcfC E-set like domain-containing protein [Pseudomonas baltica]|uniref:TcfC E-set like domain-containing protein n=1 Tax=Pseudomonas baltica TaxID=2762576 RepID=A0A7X1KS00_9PSED|nr:TcfC E-set like domain-containing protein [Pseudomonas baltica]MBC2677176.1 TcfC E-set like domain-containing protein [Pseudomonas baltica]
MFKTTSLANAIGVALGAGWLLLGPVPAHAANTPPALGILGQAQGLPADFAEHFFDVPLAVRVDLDGRLLGEALVVLGRDDTLQWLEYTDTSESRETPVVRQRWAQRLSEGVSLGSCTTQCTDGLVAVHYSLVNSQLSLLTRAVEQSTDVQRYHALPEQAEHGLILRNQLNLSQAGDETVGRYAVQGVGSVGDWSTQANLQMDKTNFHGLRHRVDQLYAERTERDRFLRLGYFDPVAQGLIRQPRLMGSTAQTALGVMLGSSDTLYIDNGTTSTTPIYVTPSRPGTVEIYRNGQLINTQAVQPGLQTLDTRVLPGGIYAVEVRLLEDGQVTSRSNEFVYKPSAWRNPEQRWRYNAYVGRQSTLFSNWEQDPNGGLAAGVMTNYLMHPRAIVGLSAQQVDTQTQVGTSLDWDALDRLKLYGNLYRTDRRGNGYDLQGVWSHGSGNVVLNHNRAWLHPQRERGDSYYVDRREPARLTTQTSLSVSHRLTRNSTLTARLSRTDGIEAGNALDLGWARYGQFMGTDANWRVSLFDRPGTASTDDQRNRGINLTLSMALGGPGKRLSASLGTRTGRDGERDRNASLSYQQDMGQGTLRTLGGTLNADRYGTGLGVNAGFQNSALYGDAFALSSSYNGQLSSGLNLESTLALGDGKAAFSGEVMPHDASLIVDLESDVPGLELRADDHLGGAALLRPGRNVLPVGAYRAGHVQLGFDKQDHLAADIQPPTLDYHLNKGAVQYRQLKVVRTVTVLGRVVDHEGRALKGAQVINHASRSVTEADGFFALEMSESNPTLEIRQGGVQRCLLTLDTHTSKREQDVLLLGDLSCVAEGVAALTTPKPTGEAG